MDILCKTCGHEGHPSFERQSQAHVVGAILVAVAGLFFWPLLIIAAVWLIIAIFGGQRTVCPRCNSRKCRYISAAR